MGQNRFVQWLVYDWPVKIISLLTAVLLFFFVQFMQLEERSFTVPLRVEIGNDVTIDSTYPKVVEVTVKGPQEDVFLIYPEDIEAVLELSDVTDAGMYLVPVTIRRSEAFQSIEDVQLLVEPANVRVHVKRGDDSR